MNNETLISLQGAIYGGILGKQKVDIQKVNEWCNRHIMDVETCRKSYTRAALRKMYGSFYKRRDSMIKKINDKYSHTT